MPCFAVGRAQEILLTVHDLGFPVFMDGMCLEATRIAISHPEYTNNAGELADAFNRVRKIRNDKMRMEAISKPSIIITTAGMMTGGPVDYYMRRLWKDEKSSIILSGYQVEGTPGRILMDTGRYVSSGLNVEPKMRFEFIDLSAHTDRSHMMEFVKRINPKKVVLVHGDKTEEYAKEFKGMGFDACAPANGETVQV
jgi:putative mRNA 3-end processing factor